MVVIFEEYQILHLKLLYRDIHRSYIDFRKRYTNQNPVKQMLFSNTVIIFLTLDEIFTVGY